MFSASQQFRGVKGHGQLRASFAALRRATNTDDSDVALKGAPYDSTRRRSPKFYGPKDVAAGFFEVDRSRLMHGDLLAVSTNGVCVVS